MDGGRRPAPRGRPSPRNRRWHRQYVGEFNAALELLVHGRKPGILNYLESLRATRPYMNVSYIDGASGESFPKDQNFDTVVCLNVIEHVPDDVGALRNI